MVCRHKLVRRPAVCDHLLAVNRELNAHRHVDEVVPMGDISEGFKEYMKASSIEIGQAQVAAPPP